LAPNFKTHCYHLALRGHKIGPESALLFGEQVEAIWRGIPTWSQESCHR